METVNQLSLFLSVLKTIQAEYPDNSIQLHLPLDIQGKQTPLMDSPDGKLYLWWRLKNKDIHLYPANFEDINYFKAHTRELTTPEGLTIVTGLDLYQK